jgi:hypothetical protein
MLKDGMELIQTVSTGINLSNDQHLEIAFRKATENRCTCTLAQLLFDKFMTSVAQFLKHVCVFVLFILEFVFLSGVEMAFQN